MELRCVLSISLSKGSDSLPVQSVEKGRSERPEIAWDSDIFSCVVHDVKQGSPARPDSYAFSGSYGLPRGTGSRLGVRLRSPLAGMNRLRAEISVHRWNRARRHGG
jgi:hypothetical protein